MINDDRRAAISAYKERKTVAGIYAVRCLSSGETWVGRAPDLSTIQNRLWFTLRLGTNTHRSLQQASQVHGVEGLTFEVIEQIEDEESAYVRDRILKSRHAHWSAQLGAAGI